MRPMVAFSRAADPCDVADKIPEIKGVSQRAPNAMKHSLRCHDFGVARISAIDYCCQRFRRRSSASQNRASPQGVAAIIAASFVATLANTASIGCGSLRAIDDPGSQRTRVSLR
jgi:hypothetical protein